jgi:hypothetical protein
MRKVALLAALVAAVFGVVSIAQAIEADQGLIIKTTGKKGTKKKPTAIKLSVLTTTAGKGANPDGTFGTTKAVIHFDKNLIFNNKKFKTCTEAVVNATQDESGCPKGSKVSVDKGSGAKAQAGPEPGAIHVNPAIRAYNGPGGTLILKLVSPPGEFNATGTIVAKLGKDTGKYGSKLTVPIPVKYYNNLGLKITLQRFATIVSATTKVAGKSVPYVASVGCTGGKYNFAGDFTFTDGAVLKAKATSKC